MGSRGSNDNQIITESWLSGLKQQFTKLPSLNGFQGFESLTLRKYQNPKHVFGFCCILRESKGFEAVASDFAKIATTDTEHVMFESLTLHILELARDTMFRVL